MTESIHWSCDCGCGKVAKSAYEMGNWFTLSQEHQDMDRTGPKLTCDCHFATLSCLNTWLLKAIPASESMLQHAMDFPRHGTLTTDEVSNLQM